MKKIVFAGQVIGLIAMFPIVVILEMNHVKGDKSESDSPEGIMPRTEKQNIRFTDGVSDKMANDVVSTPLQTLLLKNVF